MGWLHKLSITVTYSVRTKQLCISSRGPALLFLSWWFWIQATGSYSLSDVATSDKNILTSNIYIAWLGIDELHWFLYWSEWIYPSDVRNDVPKVVDELKFASVCTLNVHILKEHWGLCQYAFIRWLPNWKVRINTQQPVLIVKNPQYVTIHIKWNDKEKQTTVLSDQGIAWAQAHSISVKTYSLSSCSLGICFFNDHMGKVLFTGIMCIDLALLGG